MLMSFHKVSVIIALLFLLLSAGFSRELRQFAMSDESLAPPPLTYEESEGNSREMIELDYLEAGPNTNKRSGMTLPTPDPEAPAPQP